MDDDAIQRFLDATIDQVPDMSIADLESFLPQSEVRDPLDVAQDSNFFWRY